MSRSQELGALVVTVHMSDNRTIRHNAHTAKAARHYARTLCGNREVRRITLAGPDVSCELYAA